MRVILLGPPGAGKGTQAAFVARHLDVPKISTGDIFRANISQRTPLGVKAMEHLDAGQLVPDGLTIDIVRDRLGQPDAAAGFLLDGFPRNVVQAEELDRILADNGVVPAAAGQAYVDIALDLEIDNDEVVKRISGRRLCRNDSGHIFHVDYSPSAAGAKCDICGGELYQRADDAEDVVRTRLEVYAAETAPIIDYYREQDVATTIDGTGEVEAVTRRAFAAVDIVAGGRPRLSNPNHPTSATTPAVKGRSLAVLRNDDPSTEDLLGIVSDVETLAELIAAKGTAPPLAIALLGEWGAGKSSVMRQVEARVAELVGLSREHPTETSFVTAARQVRFNAWHYSDENLWLGLIDNLFSALSADSSSGENNASDLTASAGELSRLRERREECEKSIDRIDKALRSASVNDSSIGSLRIARWDTRLRAAVALSPRLWNEARRNAGFLVIWLTLFGLAVGVWTAYHSALVGAFAALIALASPVHVLWRTVRKWWTKAGGLASHSTRELEKWRGEQQRKLDDINSRVMELDAAERLSKFIADHDARGTYAGYRGLMGKVHADLAQLTTNLRRAHEQWAGDEDRAGNSQYYPPLQRIVLYIDDLDRCAPERVVEVLAAVHLMLALPLFVVVVAVDPRWLLGALHHHYRELFEGNVSPTEGEPSDDLVSPLDYLDKIFQIPFALRAMEADTTGRYIATLMSAQGSADLDVADSVRTAGFGASALELGLDDVEPEFSTATPGPRRNLNPAGLVVRGDESLFMSRLGPLLSTPRAAKKLVNLYRLARIRVDDSELDRFIADGDYRIVQILLAVLVGNPGESRTVFCSLLEAAPGAQVRDVLVALPQTPYCAKLFAVLEPMLVAGELSSGSDAYRKWCRELARYSFHTRSIISSDNSWPIPPRSGS